MPQSVTFIKKYLNWIRQDSALVCCGGIMYEKEKPINKKMLRWVFGKKREEINVDIRKNSPYSYFLGSNFLIHKSVFKTVRFNENIMKYGYEDTLFVEDLRKKHITIEHNDISVYHLGIEESGRFLNKTRQALDNLKELNRLGVVDEKFIKVLRVYNKIKSKKQDWIFSLTWRLFNKLLEYNLKSKKPSIYIFDIYKLTYFSYINN